MDERAYLGEQVEWAWRALEHAAVLPSRVSPSLPTSQPLERVAPRRDAFTNQRHNNPESSVSLGCWRAVRI